MLENKNKLIDLLLDCVIPLILMCCIFSSKELVHAFGWLFIMTCTACLEFFVLKCQNKLMNSKDSILDWVIWIKVFHIILLPVLLVIFLTGICFPKLQFKYENNITDIIILLSFIGLLLWTVSVLLLLIDPRKEKVKKISMIVVFVFICLWLASRISSGVYYLFFHQKINSGISSTVVTLVVGVFFLQILSFAFKKSEYISVLPIKCRIDNDNIFRAELKKYKDKLSYILSLTKYPFALSETLYKRGAMQQYTKFMSKYFPLYPDRHMVMTNGFTEIIDRLISFISPYLVVAFFWSILYAIIFIVNFICDKYFVKVYEDRINKRAMGNNRTKKAKSNLYG